MSTEISPQKVTLALQQLNEVQSKELIFLLGVPINLLDDIDANCRGLMRKIRYVQVWLDHDVTASWEKVVSSLKMMGLNSLAYTLASEHCPSNIPSSTIVAPTSVLPPSPPANVTEKEGPSSPNDVNPDPTARGSSSSLLPTPSHLPPPHLPPSSPPTLAPPTYQMSPPASPPRLTPLPPSPPPIPPSLANRVTKTRAEIDQLGDNFSSIMSDTSDELCEKESNNSSFLDRFRNRLMELPVAQNAPHNKFFTRNEDDLLMAKSMHKLFAILRRYCNYRNYEILKEVVRKFCEIVLKQRMEKYCVSLENFERATTVDVYLIAENAGDVLRSEFERLTVKINKPPSECTLYEIRKVTRSMEEKASLHLYSVYIGSPSEGSVQVELGIHPDCVGRILAVLDPQFLQSHHLSVVCQQQQVMRRNVSQRELNEELLSASKSGDLMRVTSLLNSGADVQTMDTDYRKTLLFKASERGHLQMVYLLTGRGAKVDSKDNWTRWTPLMMAARGGHYKIVMELLSLGADVNAQDKYGWSALIWAASLGHTKVVMELVKAGANLDQLTINGNSALVKAAINGKTDTVIQLVKLGANLNLQNKYGDSALMRAAYNGKTDTVIQMVKLGANLNLQNKHGDSAVIRAVTSYRSNLEIIKELVRGESNLNLQNQEGLTALMIAIRNERSELVDVLLEGRDDIDMNIQQNETGWSAIFFAVESGNAATTQTLIAAGANQNLKDKNGLTALDIASASDKDTEEICQLLAEASITPSCPPDSPVPVQDTSLPQLNSPDPVQDTSLPKQDSPSPVQDTTLLKQDSPVKDTTVTERDVLDTAHVTSGQRRRQRRNIPETVRNLVNQSRKRVVGIFNQLGRRLKSSINKKQPRIGQL